MSDKKRVLVIGGGIAGMTAAVEAAEVGHEVVLVERESYLGGRVARTHRYFPKMCPPSCGMEINFRRIRTNPRITVYTLAEVEKVSGQAGDFTVTIKVRPRYVTGKVGLSPAHAEGITSERPDDFNLGMDKTKALYLPHPMAYPPQYVLDKDALSAEDRQKLEEACPEGAIDFDMAEQMVEEHVGAIIIATGWQPYDAAKLEHLGFGTVKNVITNVMMERLAAGTGPTGGKIVRPSDDKEAKKIAFVQCAGSRDENHLPYCSGVCCMGSLKQARYVREAYEDAKVTVFYIDVRTISRHEDFYYDLLEDENVSFVKGKAAKITEDAATGNPVVEVEDTIKGELIREQFDLVVLAVGMVPSLAEAKLPFDVQYDEYGFVADDGQPAGIFAAGVASRPVDVARSVRAATGAALKAIQCA